MRIITSQPRYVSFAHKTALFSAGPWARLPGKRREKGIQTAALPGGLWDSLNGSCGTWQNQRHKFITSAGNVQRAFSLTSMVRTMLIPWIKNAAPRLRIPSPGDLHKPHWPDVANYDTLSTRKYLLYNSTGCWRLSAVRKEACSLRSIKELDSLTLT